MGQFLDRPGQWRDLRSAERLLGHSQPRHRIDDVDDRRPAAGQRPGLSRQPERDRHHPDRNRPGRRRLRRLDARDLRQRLQCRRPENSPATALRRASCNAGSIEAASGGFVGLIGGTVVEFGRRLGPARKGRNGLGEQATLNLTGDNFLQVAVPTDAKTADGKALIDVSGKVVAAGGGSNSGRRRWRKRSATRSMCRANCRSLRPARSAARYSQRRSAAEMSRSPDVSTLRAARRGSDRDQRPRRRAQAREDRRRAAPVVGRVGRR